MSRLTGPSSRLVRPGLRPPSSGLVHPSQQSRTSSAASVNAPQRLTASPKDSVDSGSTTPTPSLEVGDRVIVGGAKQGTVAFSGTAQFARGVWIGVILDTPDGKNDGSVNGVSYFTCEPNYGLFSRPEKLTLHKKAPIGGPVTHQKPAMVPKHDQAPLPPPVANDTQFKVGDRVLIDGTKAGVILFMGPTQFAKGPWIGICLDAPDGKNDGSVNGVQYFQCPPKHGVFTRAAKLTLDQPQKQPARSPAISKPRVLPSNESAITPEELKMKASELHPGDRVMVNGNKEGTLRFVGTTHFAKGIWVGIELDIAQGKNDGAVSGKRYFQCEPLFGLFAPLPKVEKIADADILMPPKHGNRKHSESSVSSMSSLSSMGKLKPALLDGAGGAGGPVRGTSSPTNNPLASMSSSDNLSHILFEKDHQIATLQSSLDLSDQEKMKLSEQVTEYKRQVDDLSFRLEELSVISGDQLEKVAMKDDGELDELRRELAEEREKTNMLQIELSNAQEAIQSTNSHSTEHLETLNQKIIELDNKVRELEKTNKSLTDEVNKSRKELQSAESDYKMTETAAGTLQTDLETTQQQLQETLDLCAQQETLLEEKVKEIEATEEQNRDLKKDIDRMVSERQQLIAIQEQVSSERDQALKQCDDLMSQSISVTNEQSQLAKQRSDLLQERDQARAELRESTMLLEQTAKERDEIQRRLDEIVQSREEAQGRTQEFSLQLDSTQNELESAQMEISKLKREITSLKDSQDNEKLINEQKIELAEAMSSDLRERISRANEERDSALQQTQMLSDKLIKTETEVEELREHAIKAHNQFQTLEEQFEDVTRSHDKLARENQMESGAIQQQLEEVQEILELKERDLQEAKEKIVSMEDELIIYQSSGSGLQDDQRLIELEEEKLLLEEKLAEQADRIEQLSSKEQISTSDEGGLLKEKEQEISFLKSVITEQQTKIETLEALNGLGENANTIGYLDSSEDDILANQLPPPRVFCDICDEFDQHDTADCPLQTQVLDDSSNTQHHAPRSHERPYCENCEVFDHWTDECEFEETY